MPTLRAMLTPRVMPTPMPASAPEVSPSEFGFCVTVDVGGGAEVVEVELLDGFDELNVLLTGTADEGDNDTEIALPLCCVTVPSCINDEPIASFATVKAARDVLLAPATVTTWSQWNVRAVVCQQIIISL